MIPTETFFFLLNHEFRFENKEKSRSEILRGELLTYSLCLKDLSETLELKFLPAVPWVKLQIPLSVTFLQHLASHKISERDLSFNENCVPPAFCQGNQGDVNVSVSRQISHPSYSLYGCDRRGVGWSFLHHYFNYFQKKNHDYATKHLENKICIKKVSSAMWLFICIDILIEYSKIK